MRVGDIGNAGAVKYGKPLDGIRVLAIEQMQALPYATQMLARLGAEVIKVEHPKFGESGRTSTPTMKDPEGRDVGSTFLRNNLDKRSVGIDLKADEGKALIKALVPHFDVVAENFKSGAMAKMGLGYDDLSAVHPGLIYLSVSGFGNTVESPYDGWPAYAGVAEAMASLYSWSTPVGTPPKISPLGALGDTGSGVFAVIGVLAALRHRDATGEGQYVDISMFDCMVALADVMLQYDAMEVERTPGDPGLLILDSFLASDGYFMIQVGREHQFERLANIIGCPEWLTDERFATRQGWVDHKETVIRPAIEGWAADKKKVDVCRLFAEGGVAAGPCNSPADVMADPHVIARNMVVEMDRTDGVERPVVTPGNPVKLSKMAEGPETRVPWVGEHTSDVLAAELGLDDAELARLREAGVIN
ncbi:MAG: CoA transferase [Acidimicrobiales bacterium]|nr:CoA transferase [Acidimicrobiales bacterium]